MNRDLVIGPLFICSVLKEHRGIGMIKIMDDFMGLIIAFALFAPFAH